MFQGESVRTYGFSELEETHFFELEDLAELDDRIELDDSTELEETSELDDITELDETNELDVSAEFEDVVELEVVAEFDDAVEPEEVSVLDDCAEFEDCASDEETWSWLEDASVLSVELSTESCSDELVVSSKSSLEDDSSLFSSEDE